MMKSSHIDHDIVIGQYTLGLLSPKESQHIQELLSADPAAAQRVLLWENNFLALVDALPQIQPPEELLHQILTTLDLPDDTDSEAPPADEASHTEHHPETAEHIQTDTPEAVGTHQEGASIPIKTRTLIQPEPSRVTEETSDTPVETSATQTSTPPPVSTKRPNKSVRLGGGLLVLVVIVLLALALLPQTPAEPPITIVEVAPTKGAILQAPGQSSTPGWVVTIDFDGNVVLTPKVHTEVPPDASVQLWTYNKVLPQPRSLGLIDPNQPVAIPANLMGEIGDDQFFEMTLEAQGGSASTEPGGPILFIGRVVTFGQ